VIAVVIACTPAFRQKVVPLGRASTTRWMSAPIGTSTTPAGHVIVRWGPTLPAHGTSVVVSDPVLGEGAWRT